jgi:AcrR family transcriptional regulator
MQELQRTRRRGAAFLAALHAAVLEEVGEVGLGRLTMEGIARRAGTAKTSLYRRWSSPHELLLDAIAAEYPTETVSPGGDDLRGDLVRALELMVEWSRLPSARAVMAIVGERQRYPELADALFARVFDPAGRRFSTTVLWHYAELGQVDGERITPVVEDIGEALVLKYAIDKGEEPPRAYLERIVDEAILPAVGRV